MRNFREIRTFHCMIRRETTDQLNQRAIFFLYIDIKRREIAE